MKKPKFPFSEIFDRGVYMYISFLFLSYYAVQLIRLGELNAVEIVLFAVFVVYAIVTFFVTSEKE